MVRRGRGECAYPDGYLAVGHAGLAGEVVSFGVGGGGVGGEGAAEVVFGVVLLYLIDLSIAIA